MKKVLFVCMGNICRSPTAHGVFEKMVADENLSEQFEIDSAGTIGYHQGSSPDRRSQKTALSHGVDLSYISSRPVVPEDFAYFDYVLAMDQDNFDDLVDRCPPEYTQKVQLFLEYAPKTGYTSVPDPYYSGDDGFELVYDLVEKASRGLLEAIKKDL
jgi:protein-tyrosine phosphatase